ncbi:MAG: agmatinase [Saprospiraceae bacterium]|nr:agmatinase [Saprospiraceae bacterium]
MSNRIYAGLESGKNEFDNARVLLQSVPFDGTSTWGKGADQGFEAFCDASDNMEIYDIETDSEPYLIGVHILDEIAERKDATAMFNATYETTQKMLKTGKFLTAFGGEHSISIGIIKAHYEHFENLTVLQMDAHTDLRPEYHGTPYNHACAVYDASKNANLIQVGIRSMDVSEKEHLDYNKVYFAENIMDNDYWMEEALGKMTDNVYITFDLDCFDSSIMPSTGTPEPGGMYWYQVLDFLRRVYRRKNVVGFDIVELAPNPHNPAPNFIAAKLYYKMLAYKFENELKNIEDHD